ncbi:hypothetical protein KIPB_005799 [Kipferlia bialata]|uniref:Uncharacterized protein n=1 Tax=Kipferlia bialata TaxID=797122 RepID=A0A9K3GIS1_9EUKA|nr:hypothetical protein KIPB_005799 [Kipferlia bialata]|eukprot:g5799.t1
MPQVIYWMTLSSALKFIIEGSVRFYLMYLSLSLEHEYWQAPRSTHMYYGPYIVAATGNYILAVIWSFLAVMGTHSGGFGVHTGDNIASNGVLDGVLTPDPTRSVSLLQTQMGCKGVLEVLHDIVNICPSENSSDPPDTDAVLRDTSDISIVIVDTGLEGANIVTPSGVEEGDMHTQEHSPPETYPDPVSEEDTGENDLHEIEEW